MFISSLILIAAATTGASTDDGWATFSASGIRSRIETSVSIGTKDTRTKPITYSFRRTIKRPGDSLQISHVDTQQCPALLTLLRSLGDLPAPRASVPFLDGDDIIVTADGIDYVLKMPAAYPSASAHNIILTSNVGTPLAAWIESALSELNSCIAAHPAH